MNQKQHIILNYVREEKSQRQISKETGIARETIRKYINEYENNLTKVNDSLGK